MHPEFGTPQKSDLERQWQSWVDGALALLSDVPNHHDWQALRSMGGQLLTQVRAEAKPKSHEALHDGGLRSTALCRYCKGSCI